VLRIGFELEGEGRGILSLTTDDLEVRVAAGDASDPLGDLAAAVVALLTGQREAAFSTFDPPAEHLWRLRQTGRGAVVFEVERSDACVDLEPGAPRRSLLAVTLALRDVAVAVLELLEGISRSHGVAGYRQIWRSHAFPSAQRARLRTLVKRSRERSR